MELSNTASSFPIVMRLFLELGSDITWFAYNFGLTNKAVLPAVKTCGRLFLLVLG